MALKINYNFQSDFTHANMLKTEYNVNKNLERLATGNRINRAADDAAGLYIADQLKTFALSLDQGTKNAQDGISIAQIAQGSFSEAYNILNDIKTKAIQAANDSQNDDTRNILQQDINQLIDAMDKIFDDTKFNGTALFDKYIAPETDDDGNITADAKGKELIIHYGAETNKTLTMEIGAVKIENNNGTYTISIGNKADVTIDVTSQSSAETAIADIDALIKELDKQASKVGSYQIELEKIVSNNTTMAVNTRDGESRIRNIDFAKEMADFTKNNILMQSGTAMLAQANQQSQLVLQLLR